MSIRECKLLSVNKLYFVKNFAISNTNLGIISPNKGNKLLDAQACASLDSSAGESGDHQQSGQRLEAVLVAYGDDSADSRKETVFSVGVVLGSPAQWVKFKSRWVERNGGIPFHATDCESGWGDYRGKDRDIRTRLYRDLVAMLAEGELFGFAAAVNIKDFRKAYPTEKTQELAYYMCLADVLARCAALGYITMPPQKIGLTFDRNFDRDPSIADWYAYLGELTEWEFHSHLGDRVTFANYREEPGVQVADLLAREAMKHMENTMLGNRERWSRVSFMRLQRSPRMHFRFVDLEEMASIAHQFGSSSLGPEFADEYKNWRLEHGIEADTIIHRIRFMRLWESVRRKAADRQNADSFDE